MEKTIAVRLKGGLGNQLFQYAAGRFLAGSWGRRLVLLTDFLDRPAGEYTARHFELGQFGLQPLVADKQTQKQVLELSLLGMFGLAKRPLVITEENFFRVEDKGQQVILDGYFQSEKYFLPVRSQLVAELRKNFSGDPEFHKQRAGILAENSVAIHVRRGDYVSLPSASQYHGVLEVDYFNRAINFITQREKQPRFYVFSDDIDWCRKIFPSTDNFFFQTTKHKHSGSDLMLMSYCKHQVISNSSYSWWAAWLNDHPGKRVIAPKNWFKDPEANAGEIYCKDWMLL